MQKNQRGTSILWLALILSTFSFALAPSAIADDEEGVEVDYGGAGSEDFEPSNSDRNTYGANSDAQPGTAKNDEDIAAFYVDPPPKVLDEKTKKSLCSKLSGVVSYSGTAYLVSKCQAIELNSKDIPRYTKGKKIIEIDSDTFASLEEKKAESATPKSKAQICQRVEGRVVVYFEEMSLVQKCKRRVFPDLESYVEYRGKLRPAHQPIPLDESDLNAIPLGEPMPSVLTPKGNKANIDDTPDLIPVNEACANITGTYVSYLSKIYKIESKVDKKTKMVFCTKEELNAETFSMQNGRKNLKLKEINASQAISIPDKK